jgi:hypothetical protein
MIKPPWREDADERLLRAASGGERLFEHLNLAADRIRGSALDRPGGQRDQRAAGFNHHAATEDDRTPAWTAKKPADLPRSSSRRGLTSWSISGPPPATRADQITDGTGAGGLGGALSWRTFVSLGRVSVLALSMGDFRAWG